jgi:putative oxidoreductase
LERLEGIIVRINGVLDAIGGWLPQIGLRLLLAWEFWEAGLQKLRGENWFGDIRESFPFPFNVVPVDVSWTMATWTELLAPVLLVVGLATRFAGVSLLILTIVATAAVHWPAQWNGIPQLLQGYVITDEGHGNFKLPVLFIAMLLPLIFSGAGRLSLDHLIARRYGRR